MTLVLPQLEPVLVCPSHLLIHYGEPVRFSGEPQWPVLYVGRSLAVRTPANIRLHRFEAFRRFEGFHKLVVPNSPEAHKWDSWTAEHSLAWGRIP